MNWPQAPTDSVATDYDRRSLALYAALIDAAASGKDWRESAARLMGIDVSDDRAYGCWQSHLDRARWIVGDGLGSAIQKFGHHE